MKHSKEIQKFEFQSSISKDETGEVKIEQREDDKETPTMVIDENQDTLDEKPEEKMEGVSTTRYAKYMS